LLIKKEKCLQEFFIILFVAFSLGLDAFSVSVAAGAYFGKADAHQKFRLSFHFGLFQFFMPILGWLLGRNLLEYIESFDHWVVFIILAIIGGKMIWDNLKEDGFEVSKDISKGMAMVTLSIATSIDALAVGIGIGLLDQNIWSASIIIGIVAAAMSLIGIKIGEKLSGKFGAKAAILGGFVLILIGIKVVLEHELGFAFI
jgi:putative Mn2+ efflux pump MntP